MKPNPITRRRGRPLSHPEQDQRTPQEITWWNENITALAHKRPPLPLAQPKRKYGSYPPEIPIPHIKLADAWTFDAVQFLKELAHVREMILSIPALPADTPDPTTATEYYTLGTRSRMQDAVDRIWHLEQDLRFFLSLRTEGQRSFAKKTQPVKKHTAKVTPADAKIVQIKA
jgi:hypothetical protein